MSNLPSMEELHELFDYDPDTGVLTHEERPEWRFKSSRSCNTWNARYAGKVAGSVDTDSRDGYQRIRIRIGTKTFNIGRVIWKWMTGEDPEGLIDHIDGDTMNNRWSNLRIVTHKENARNVARSNKPTKSGVTGVTYSKETGKWIASLLTDEGRKYLGLFETIEEAASVLEEERKLHGYTERHGKDYPKRVDTAKTV